MKVQMKPETIARRAVERRAAASERKAQLIARLQVMATKEPDGIWKELLAEVKPPQDWWTPA